METILKGERLINVGVAIFVGVVLFFWFASPNIIGGQGGSVTVTAAVVAEVSCSVSTTSIAFGTLSTTTVTSAAADVDVTLSCTTATLGCELRVYDAGNGENGGLDNQDTTYLIPSPNAAFASQATLVSGTEGYGINATSTVNGGGNFFINSRYNYGDLATTTVGKLSTSTAPAANLQFASSTDPITGTASSTVRHKAAIQDGTTVSGSYEDTITWSCLGN